MQSLIFIPLLIKLKYHTYCIKHLPAAHQKHDKAKTKYWHDIKSI